MEREGGHGFDLQAAVRPNIWRLKPYRCARDDYTSGVLLDANENSFGSPLEASSAAGLERYPCPYQWELKERVAALRGVQKEQVFVGVGSDEAIDMLIRIFCVPGKDKLLICSPTYGMYSVSAETNDVEVLDIPLNRDFQLEVDEILTSIAAQPEVKLLFLCSPGNPTCLKLDRGDLIKILSCRDYKGVVVVDEAYVDFAGEGASMCDLVSEYPQLVVMQTMSKAWGLAGIRCGFAIAAAETIEIMNRVKAPYSMNSLTSKLAIEAFDQKERFHHNMGLILQERDRLRVALEQLVGIVHRVLPSDTNFLMFQIDNAEAVYKQMADQGVVVRYRGNCLHCEDCLRVTVGRKEENDKFLELLQSTCASLK